jgi:hypothetical protein
MMKTPAPERAAGRKKLAAKGQALPGGTAPVPDLAYLRKAIRAKGRVDPAKWPALKKLIVKRAKQLKATNAPGVKGTWPFQGANTTEAVDLAVMPRAMMPVRGGGDVQLARDGGKITATHKGSGRKIGVLAPAGKGWAGTHADGTPTGGSGSQQGALTGLIAYHNARARRQPAQQDTAAAGAKTYANSSAAVDLAGSLPYTSNASSTDGPRVTTMGGGGAGKQVKPAAAASPAGLSPYAAALYKKFIAKKMKPAVALAFARRADAMHAKAAKTA